MDQKRILVAGIGNVFHGDDAFGVEVVKALAQRDLPEAVQVTDFGTRSYDLAFAMLDGYEAVIFVDAAPRGKEPGTVVLLEADAEAAPMAGPVNGHSMDPVTVLRLIDTMGGYDGRVLVVACEPATLEPDRELRLSPAVRDAVAPAADLVVETVEHLLAASTELEKNVHAGG